MIGKTISHYKILSKLGEGGMGVVYKAQDLKLPRFVALKFLTPTFGDDVGKKRFIHEAEAASALDHPNICGIYEIDETPDGRLFLSMPCYEGETLQQKIERGPLKLDEVIELAVQVASGLSKAHDKGIVHRDIKPGNIFLTGDGLVKIVDFGLAKLAAQTGLTRSGAVVGTATYMSPEQARGDEVDHRSDIWALGVVLYEMVTGRLPFKGEHEPAIVYSIMNEKPEPVTALRTGVPMGLERLIDKCTAKNPAERYQHADELIVDLKRVKNDLAGVTDTAAARSTAGAAGKRHGRLWIASVLVVVLAAAFFILRPIILGESTVAAPKPIAVIGFENQTGDESYNYLQEVIPNLLITRLEQSKHLSVITWERLHDLLNQRGRGDLKLIDKEVGFELCRMDGIDTIVLGSFTKAGDVFVTDAKVLDVQSKALLKSASAKGDGVGSILASQIDELGHEISRGIGLSERSIVTGGRPIAEVTTRSMDAYHFFLKGRDELEDRYADDARRSLERAVELDSTFAVAWLYLGLAYRSLRDINSAEAAYVRAKRLAVSAPEKDRLYIEALYAMTIERDNQKYFDLLQELVRKYPKEKFAHVQMALCYESQNQLQAAIESYEKALALDPRYGDALNGIAYEYANLEDYPTAIGYLERYAAVSPGDTNPIDSMAEMYFRLGDLDKAVELYEKTLEIRPDIGAEVRLAYIVALKEDYAGAIEWCDRFIDATPFPGLKGQGLFVSAFYRLFACRYNDARQAALTARTVFERMGYAVGNAGTWWIEGWALYHLGEYDQARQRFAECSSILNQPKMYGSWLETVTTTALGLIDVKEGWIEAAREKLAQTESAHSAIDEEDPVHSLIARDFSLLLEGEILLAEERTEEAVEVLKKRPDVGIPTLGSRDILFYNFPTESDVLARAYAAQGAADEAVAEYERLVTFDAKIRNRRLIYPLFHYRLARLYEEKGRAAESVREYEKFLAVSKDADEGMIERVDAGARLERLTGNQAQRP